MPAHHDHPAVTTGGPRHREDTAVTTYPIEIDRAADHPTLRLGVVLGALFAGLVLLAVLLIATDTIGFAADGIDRGRASCVSMTGGSAVTGRSSAADSTTAAIVRRLAGHRSRGPGDLATSHARRRAG